MKFEYDASIRHCERSEAIHAATSRKMDCFAALAMTAVDVVPPQLTLPLQQQVKQMRDQRDVGRRHRVVAQFAGADPGQLLALARDRGAFPAPADVERHQKMEG